jgi:hypothetical protein
MRPEEINHSSRARHFIDLSNSEVLVGVREFRKYQAACEDPTQVVEIGPYLRSHDKPPDTDTEVLDVSSWDEKKYVEYGRWLLRIVPESDTERPLNRDIINNAKSLGIGPGYRTIMSVFGNLATFYSEVKAPGLHVIGNFKTWTLENYVAYLREFGEKRPTSAEVDKRSKRDPTKPNVDYMRTQFSDIGGFIKLLELAGYTVIDLWDKKDYTAWGVRFMEANEGLIPTSRMADFLSTQKLGPSGTSIRNKFDSMGDYQKTVIRAYEEAQKTKSEAQVEYLKVIKYLLRNKTLPTELFQHESGDFDKDNPLPEPVIRDDLEAYPIGADEIVIRYAKYRVINELLPYTAEVAKIKLAITPGLGKAFIANIRRNYVVDSGEVERAALLTEVFEVLWPAEGNIEKLKLGEAYEEYYKRIEKVKVTRSLQRV